MATTGTRLRVGAPKLLKPLLRRSRLAHRVALRLRPEQSFDPAQTEFADLKRAKLARIEPLLKPWTPYERTPLAYDFLSDELRAEFHIADTDNVSSHEYDGHALELIEEFADGIVLDCGAGLRPTYYPNVVNFEICSYPTTDVRGVGEKLPFRDDSFDAVISLAVLEHVRDPFMCAAEIARVLKPGGKLYCCVPFLQPLHGYPSHYFNMTHQGLGRLFEDTLEFDSQSITIAGRPIFSLTWMLRNWLSALPPDAAAEFAAMTVAELTANPLDYIARPFVAGLPEAANFELASSTTLFAHKPATAPTSSLASRIISVRRKLSRATR